MIMETLKTFLIIIVVVLSFGVAVIAGQNGLLSARCAARCLTEHKKDLRGVCMYVNLYLYIKYIATSMIYSE